MDYNLKYRKYKLKYLQLKQQVGGVKNDDFTVVVKKGTKLWQGLKPGGVDQWVTDNIEVAKMYVPKDGSLVEYDVVEDLKMIDVYKLNPSYFSDDVVVVIKDNNGKDVPITRKMLFSIFTGIGAKKEPSVKTTDDINILESKDPSKFEGTQYYYQYLLHKHFHKNFIMWLKIIMNHPNRHIITDTNAINRMSEINIDSLFVNNVLKPTFPDYDGYSVGQVPSDWQLYEDKFYMTEEMCLFDIETKKINVVSRKSYNDINKT